VSSEAYLLVSARAARSVRSAANASAFEMIWPIGLLAAVALPLPYLLRFDRTHAVTAAALSVIICAVCLFNRRGGIIAAVVYLAMLGDYRRYVAHFEGFPTSDPLLVVGPAAALFLLGRACLDRGIGASSVLAKLLTVLMLLMTVEVFNPIQGGLQVGVAGALFYLAPLLWFWVGRTYADKEMMHFFMFRVLVTLGAIAALWGLYQTYFGLFRFEQEWVEQTAYASLQISDQIVRAIGFFTSSAELQRCLIVTAVIAWAAWLMRRSLMIALVPLMLVMIFLSAARGPLVIVAGAGVFVWAIRARSALAWVPRFVVAGGLAAGLLLMFLTFAQANLLGGRLAPIVSRQVEGLLNPLDPEKSTAVGHAELVTSGLTAGFTVPAGMGLGATTLAASKYGGQMASTEFDLSNVMVSLGILGGLIYVVIVATAIGTAVRWWKHDRSEVSLATVGVLTGTLGGWLIGEEYSMVAIVWFCIGVMDRLSERPRLTRRMSLPS
jgi:hypothetical protein